MTENTISLALQGAGYLGTFSWGVLDYLVKDTEYDVGAISATGSAATVAALFVAGSVTGGREAGLEKVENFWGQVDRAHARGNPLLSVWEDFLPSEYWKNPMFEIWKTLQSGVLGSPYDWNPLNINPFRDLVEAVVDFEAVNDPDAIRLIVSTTNALSGRLRVFEAPEITTDVLVATDAHPAVTRGVEIDGDIYWQGSITGAPALFPLYSDAPADILVVLPTPAEIETLDRTAQGLRERLEEIASQAALSRELRSAEFVRQLVAAGQMDGEAVADPRVHLIRATEPTPYDDRYVMSPSNIKAQFERGRHCAHKWFVANSEWVGVRTTLSPEDRFL